MPSQVGEFSLFQAAVGSIMIKSVKTIAEDEPLSNCVKLMNGSDIGSVIVLANGKPVGIFTERDLIRKMARDRQYLNMPISEVMSKPLTVISPRATIWDAISLMGKLNIRRLPVMENNALLGILTEKDIMRLILSQQNLRL